MLKKHIPNTITCCNLISGCIATYFAFQSEFEMALLFIVIGAVFDFFDGMSARLLGVSSPIGKELDSLADVTTFDIPHPYIPYLAFVMAAFSALRLAKFNRDERQALGFIGLPTPANALFWGSLVCGLVESGAFVAANLWWAILFMVFYASYLLISEIPMFALKFKHWGWKGNEIKYIFVISCIPLLLLFGVFSGIAFIIVWYIVLSKIAVLTKK